MADAAARVLVDDQPGRPPDLGRDVGDVGFERLRAEPGDGLVRTHADDERHGDLVRLAVRLVFGSFAREVRHEARPSAVAVVELPLALAADDPRRRAALVRG